MHDNILHFILLAHSERLSYLNHIGTFLSYLYVSPRQCRQCDKGQVINLLSLSLHPRSLI